VRDAKSQNNNQQCSQRTLLLVEGANQIRWQWILQIYHRRLFKFAEVVDDLKVRVDARRVCGKKYNVLSVELGTSLT
jgi:hypothetical protein